MPLCTSFPVKICLMILEFLSSVCEEWQVGLEKNNFHLLKLWTSFLNAWEGIVGPQKRGHIWPNMELRPLAKANPGRTATMWLLKEPSGS
ncbi:hypothetical protein LZ32DRAFT_603909 [Colletotrichum eremochloae]|nr:hypothetical protein LZ32DRAFT_603909 [Colletotrichum eremochloae]